MEIQSALRSQYHAALKTLRLSVEQCPDALWDDTSDGSAPIWRVVYHTLFYTHFYLQQDQHSFVPWARHQEEAHFISSIPWEGSELRLLSSVKDFDDIPEAGKDGVIVADVANALHFRIFDGEGKVVVDTDEMKLRDKAQQIENLRRQMVNLWPPHELTGGESDQVITAVASIVGYIPWEHTRPPKPCSPYTREELLEYWRICDDMIDRGVDALDLSAPQCGFPWYRMSTLEHQIVNIRHIQHHAAALSTRLRLAAGINIDWVGRA